MNSASELTGTEGCTTSIWLDTAMLVIGFRSFSMSMDIAR